MSLNARLQKLLDESGVEYQIIHHPEVFRARTTAATTSTPPEEFAKTVVLWIDGGFALAVLPATHYVAPSRLAHAIGAEHVRLASEFEMKDLVPDCEVGAAPPFGGLFGLPTYASALLAEDERITFNAGSHRDAVRMRWADYKRLVQPHIEHLSHHEEKAPRAAPRSRVSPGRPRAPR
jgi:Ala-tRNA(Pro) deacylase